MKKWQIKRNSIIFALILLISYSFWKVKFGLHGDEVAAIEESMMILKGAKLISECWVPLQLTSVVSAPLLAIYKTFVGSITGVILAFRYLYLVLQILIAIYIYQSLKGEYGKNSAGIISVMHYMYFYNWMTINYKSILYMGGIVTIISIYNYINRNKIVYLIIASMSSIYMILGYPHSICICFAFALAIWRLSRKSERKKGLIIYLSACFILGMIFLVYLCMQCGGVEPLLNGISGILSDEVHSDGLYHKIKRLILPIVLLGVLENIGVKIMAKIFANRNIMLLENGVMWSGLFAIALVCICLGKIYTAGPSRFWYIFLCVFLLIPYFCERYQEKELWLFMIPSVFMMLSIVAATNQGIAVVAYGCIWGLMGLALVILKYMPEYKTIVYFITVAMSFVFCFFVPDMVTGSSNIFWNREEITEGAAKGIYVEGYTHTMYNDICDVVNKYVDSADKLLIVDNTFMATVGYLSTEAIEATFAPDYFSIMTGRYELFYEKNPHREPNIIILDTTHVGDIDIYLDNSPLGTYIYQHFDENDRILDRTYVIYGAK